MTPQQEQVIYLGAVFTAALQADKLACTGHLDESILERLIQSLVVVNPRHALDVYSGDDSLFLDGYKFLAQMLNKKSAPSDPVRYAFGLLMLEQKVISKPKMMDIISERLKLIKTKIDHFGILSPNVISACAQLYQDAVSPCGARIMIRGDAHTLQKQGTPEKLRALLLTGIRAAMQWQYVGGRRWRIIFLRKKVLQPVLERINRIERSA